MKCAWSCFSKPGSARNRLGERLGAILAMAMRLNEVGGDPVIAPGSQASISVDSAISFCASRAAIRSTRADRILA